MPYIGKQPANVPVTADDIPANSIDASKIIDGAITIADIADDAVTADKLANSINSAIAANTAKTGITSGQASAITANTAKTGITSSQATAITAALPKAGGAMTGTITNLRSTGIDDNANALAMTIDSSENVGIGTTAPDQTMHIHKGSAGTVASDGNAVLTVENSSHSVLQLLSPKNQYGTIVFGNPTDGALSGRLQYDNNNNVMQFWTDSTERMRISSTGAVTMPNQPAFRLDSAGGWTAWTSGSVSKVTLLTTETHDRGNNASSSRFTAPVAGIYHFDASLYCSSAAGLTQLFIYKNGSGNVSYTLNYNTSSGDQVINGSGDVSLAVNDYVEIWARAPGNIYGGAGHTVFQGYLLG